MFCFGAFGTVLSGVSSAYKGFAKVSAPAQPSSGYFYGGGGGGGGGDGVNYG